MLGDIYVQNVSYMDYRIKKKLKRNLLISRGSCTSNGIQTWRYVYMYCRHTTVLSNLFFARSWLSSTVSSTIWFVGRVPHVAVRCSVGWVLFCFVCLVVLCGVFCLFVLCVLFVLFCLFVRPRFERRVKCRLLCMSLGMRATCFIYC